MNLVALTILFCSCVSCVRIKVINNSHEDIWLGVAPYNNSALIDFGGFHLFSHSSKELIVPNNWEGTFWPRLKCNEHGCMSGQCSEPGQPETIHCLGRLGKPPVTKVELKLNYTDHMDRYAVSLVDGFNIAARIKPLNSYKCVSSACLFDLNAHCPKPLTLNYRGGMAGCLSSCHAFYKPCCYDKYKIMRNCSVWSVNAASYFKTHCPQIKLFTIDDFDKMETCKTSDYEISFGILGEADTIIII